MNNCFKCRHLHLLPGGQTKPGHRVTEAMCVMGCFPYGAVGSAETSAYFSAVLQLGCEYFSAEVVKDYEVKKPTEEV